VPYVTTAIAAKKKILLVDDEADARHLLRQMLERGLLVTVNSDDPAYFGGYVADNFAASAAALDLSREQLLTLARNSFVASFLNDVQRRAYLDEVDRFAAQPSLKTIS